jgi:hypothetical protein
MNKTILISIHRHWLWADKIQRTFYAALPPNLRAEDTKEMFISDWGMCRCLWYGLLFAVCEALRERRFTVPTVQSDIDAIYSNLKLFRNAVFHVQPKYWSRKLFSIMQNENSAQQIKQVHDGIGCWLLIQLRAGKVDPQSA